MNENESLSKILPVSGKLTIGEWHSYHMESDSQGYVILVTDGFSKGWFIENPTHKIMTREDGTWGHDPKSTLKTWLDEDDYVEAFGE